MEEMKLGRVAGVNEFNAALDNPNVPKIYFNGFTVVTSNADISLLGMRNGRPAGVFSMPFEIAKTLVEKLDAAVKAVEDGTSTKILTTEDVDRAMQTKGSER